MKKVLVTGADGFIGKNLVFRLAERKCFEIIKLGKSFAANELKSALKSVDVIFHLAGVNRATHDDEFMSTNVGFTEKLLSEISNSRARPKIVFSSSVKAKDQTPYGSSKHFAEIILKKWAQEGNKLAIYRLPNVFGKWCRPNYNSAVATFCHNIARNLPIVINDPQSPLSLVYIDDLIDDWFQELDRNDSAEVFRELPITYQTTVGELASVIRSFADQRNTKLIDAVGTGFLRALYATYVSALPQNAFVYDLSPHRDQRGEFVEFLKTESFGQFSYFTAHPGVTRGGHYHHTKNEKFVVVEGEARFCFRNISTGEWFELETNARTPQVVETVPGWAHDITNIGDRTMVVLLWANELFNPERPDTIATKV